MRARLFDPTARLGSSSRQGLCSERDAQWLAREAFCVKRKAPKLAREALPFAAERHGQALGQQAGSDALRGV